MNKLFKHAFCMTATLNSITDVCICHSKRLLKFSQKGRRYVITKFLWSSLLTLLIASKVRCYITGSFVDFMNKKSIAYRTKAALFAK
jgi:hypothetical protein